jgi:hypothetical protein
VSTSSGSPAVAQALAPGLVLLGPQGIELARRALEAAAARAGRDGIGLPPQARALQAALEAAGSDAGTASHARVGTSEPPVVPRGALSALQDLVDVSEVVAVLGCSRPYACRLMRSGVFETARKDTGRWLVDRVELEALRQVRAQEARTA